jgi:hypothetical protein
MNEEKIKFLIEKEILTIEEAQYFREYIRAGITKEEIQSRYREYRNSKYWKMKRKQIHILANNICELCNSIASNQVHHLTYKRLGEERNSDLMAVCRGCHEKITFNKEEYCAKNLKKIITNQRTIADTIPIKKEKSSFQIYKDTRRKEKQRYLIEINRDRFSKELIEENKEYYKNWYKLLNGKRPLGVKNLFG